MSSALTYHQTFGTELPPKYARVMAEIPDKSRILEVGCHTGYFSRALAEAGHDVLGLEQDGQAAAVARSEGLRVQEGSVEDPKVIRALEGKFDVVLLMDVLEHLKDPEGALRWLQSPLKEGGKIIITGPNVAYWAVRKNLLLGRWNYQDAGILDRTHLKFFTEKTWRSLVENAGMRVTRMETADGMLPLEHVLNRVPVLSSLVPSLQKTAFRHLPGVFAIDFLIVATPL